MEHPNTRQPVPKTGDLLERTFPTPQGAVGLLAEIVVEGSTLNLRDVAIFSESATPLTGLGREVMAARTRLKKEAKSWGFSTLRITGHRVLSSSSGNPGHIVDVQIDLTR